MTENGHYLSIGTLVWAHIVYENHVQRDLRKHLKNRISVITLSLYYEKLFVVLYISREKLNRLIASN